MIAKDICSLKHGDRVELTTQNEPCRSQIGYYLGFMEDGVVVHQYPDLGEDARWIPSSHSREIYRLRRA